jgi:hypothetical protein
MTSIHGFRRGALRPAAAFLALAVLALVPARAAAQLTGSVTGRAVDAADGKGIQLSVVRLFAAGDSAGGVTALTDSAGAFRFDSVAAGVYRLRLERIGYAVASSEAFEVRDGQTADRTLRTALQPVSLPAVTVAPNQCYTADRLDQAPQLAALWREAVKGAELRRAFRRQYAFRGSVHIVGVAHLRMLRDQRIDRDSTFYSHPDSARAREAALRRRMGEGGYVRQSMTSVQVRVPDELELLADGFLAAHCLEGDPEQDGTGAWKLRFRPVNAEGGGSDIQGALHVNAQTFQVQELDFEYLRAGRSWGTGTLEFAPASTPYGMVYLPRAGTLQGQAVGTIVNDFSATLDFHDYRDFVRVDGR